MWLPLVLVQSLTHWSWQLAMWNKGTHVFAGDGVAYDPNQATIVGFGSLTTDERKPFFKKFGWTQQINYLGILWDGTREWKAAGRLWRR
jgi:hypothetical protein